MFPTVPWRLAALTASRIPPIRGNPSGNRNFQAKLREFEAEMLGMEKKERRLESKRNYFEAQEGFQRSSLLEDLFFCFDLVVDVVVFFVFWRSCFSFVLKIFGWWFFWWAPKEGWGVGFYQGRCGPGSWMGNTCRDKMTQDGQLGWWKQYPLPYFIICWVVATQIFFIFTPKIGEMIPFD